MSKLWRVALIDRANLSAEQITEGFMAYFSNPEKCNFWPQPGDIFAGIGEQRYQQENTTLKEMRADQAREENGEKFFGLRDLAQDVKAMGLKGKTEITPKVPTFFADIDPNKNAAKLKQQAEMLKGKRPTEERKTT